VTATDGAGRVPFKAVAFAGAANWPLWAGLENGLFAAEGLILRHVLTPHSRAMASDLFTGAADLALTAIDNIVAYNEGQGEAELAGSTDFVAVMGVDDGMLSLMASPEIEKIADLKGRAVSVDALSTGFAFVLRELLGETQVDYVRVGGGKERLAALIAGEQSATLLNAPLDLVAEAAGFRRLARARDRLGAYQGVVAAVRRGWAAEHRDLVTAFIRAYHKTVGWLAAPANRAAAIDLLRARMPVLDPAIAGRAYALLLDPASGIFRDLAIDLAGVESVLRLRRAYAADKRTLSAPACYIDDSFRRDALGSPPGPH